jgi:hypothetical protein
MKTPITKRWGMLLPLLMMAASHASGSLGETPKQMEGRRPDSVEQHDGGFTCVWRGKTLTHSGFFANGVAIVETFWFNDHHVMLRNEYTRFLEPYRGFRTSAVDDSSNDNACFFNLLYRDGTRYAVVMYNFRMQSLSIWRPDAWDYFAARTTEPRIQPQPPVVQPPARQAERPKLDCMVVATENLHRLAEASAWSNILCFKYLVDGRTLAMGHAVAVWKITPDGKVFSVDDSGTSELDTTSTEAKDILAALGLKYSEGTDRNFVLVGHFAVDGKKTKK